MWKEIVPSAALRPIIYIARWVVLVILLFAIIGLKIKPLKRGTIQPSAYCLLARLTFSSTRMVPQKKRIT